MSTLEPFLSDFVENLNHLVEASGDDNPIDLKRRSNLVSWVIKLNNASESIFKKEDNTFLNDLGVAYRGFISNSRTFTIAREQKSPKQKDIGSKSSNFPAELTDIWHSNWSYLHKLRIDTDRV
jgi:hypothetical protein